MVSLVVPVLHIRHEVTKKTGQLEICYLFSERACPIAARMAKSMSSMAGGPTTGVAGSSMDDYYAQSARL